MNELIDALERLATLRSNFKIWKNYNDEPKYCDELIEIINNCMKIIVKLINEQIEEAQNET